jgi:hypothetical protein
MWLFSYFFQGLLKWLCIFGGIATVGGYIMASSSSVIKRKCTWKRQRKYLAALFFELLTDVSLTEVAQECLPYSELETRGLSRLRNLVNRKMYKLIEEL